jgi:hypothetical protein
MGGPRPARAAAGGASHRPGAECGGRGRRLGASGDSASVWPAAVTDAVTADDAAFPFDARSQSDQEGRSCTSRLCLSSKRTRILPGPATP